MGTGDIQGMQGAPSDTGAVEEERIGWSQRSNLS